MMHDPIYNLKVCEEHNFSVLLVGQGEWKMPAMLSLSSFAGYNKGDVMLMLMLMLTLILIMVLVMMWMLVMRLILMLMNTEFVSTYNSQ